MLRCVVAILCMSLLSAQSFNMNKCVEKERHALLKFKDALTFGGDNSITSWKGEECCKWEGISCDNLTGHVISLNLQSSEYGKEFGGKLDSSICELQYLTSLNLADHLLEGNIPNCIGSLAHLIELNLNENNLVGVVPPSLGNLSNLQTLDLGGNYAMSVNDLDWVSHLSNLRYLDLSSLNLTLAVDWLSSTSKPSLSQLHLSNCGLHNVSHKSIPHLNSSISLKSLDLRENSLNSSILQWVINVSKVLTHLDLASNSFQQSIPHEFGNMIFLQYLDLSYNSLQQSIPYEFGNMTFLRSLDLSNNEFQGSIPKSFRSMCQLNVLTLNSNKLSGQLSDNMQQLCCAENGLEYLDLSDNPFTSEPLPNLPCFSSLVTLSLENTNLVGMLPKSLFHLSFPQNLYLSHNHLSGVDSIDDANRSALRVLDLSFNQLSGPFPQVICQLSSLESLSLSSNKLNDIINKTHLSNLSNLKILDVSQNTLSFNLTSDWIPSFKLTNLYASSCKLGPEFPVWLKHQTELIVLDISNTGISDSFPKWFWNLTLSLEYLHVSHNKLNGPLPKSFPNTKVNYDSFILWDFSFNNLTGQLPPFPELQSLFLSNNMFTGSLSSFCTSFSHSLIYLDLSSNFLAGELTDCWNKFHSLRFLNLAKNNLSGKVPSSFGALREIESLHLNNNKFFGEIPSLILCHNLKLIDVGYNNLQGTLPIWNGDHLPMLIVIILRANKFQGNIPTNMCNLSYLQVLDLSINNVTGEIPQCLSDIIAFSNLKFPRTSFHYFSSLDSYMGNVDKYDEFGSFNDKAILSLKGSSREYDKNLELVTSIDLSCNHLTGEIPQSITKLVALFGLNLSHNNLTGFIPSNIGHMQSLESLDLSRNQLSGRMPVSFSNLTFLESMNLSFNNLEGEIPLSTQLQSLNSSSFVGNDRLCGPPLIHLCHDGVISPTRSHEDEDKFITFGFYVSLGLGFIIGFWGVCGTLVIKTSWRNAYFKFFKNINDWIQITLAVFVIKLKRRFQVEE